MGAPNKPQPQKGRKPRRRRNRPARADATEAIRRAEPVVIEGAAEEPLSPDEIARLKSTFAFLKKHRTTLKLRVNAAEDLLLNGKREPTHRGVCQHLLSKVEKAKVIQASERLPADAATDFMAGVIRFAPELPYLVRFLECVRASAGQKQATAALTQALGQIDFDEASNAQVRQVLELIVDIFPAREQPVLLLSLLRGKAFRTAFDRSSEGFPESLAEMLVPLRAVHQLLQGGKRSRSGRKVEARPDPALLQEGALLLLRVDQRSLLEFNEPVRRKLFQLLCEISSDAVDVPREGLMALFKSLRFNNPGERATVLRGFVGLLLKAGFEKDAKGILRKEIERDQGNKDSSEHSFLLALLAEPRLGSFAFVPPRGENPPKGGSKFPPSGRFHPAMHLVLQQRARVVWVEAEQRAALTEDLQVWTSTLIPQVLLPLDFDVATESKRPFVAIKQLESSLGRSIERATLTDLHEYLLDLCRLAACLNAQGVRLPDGDLRRFAVSSDGRVWLTDLLGVGQDHSDRQDITWLKETLLEIEREAPALSFSDDRREALNQAPTVQQIAEALLPAASRVLSS